ncbi:hypothetical protein [Pedobacter agri]|uniref:hypothetical protein n=1 Tax=Pedobacter agri TaxID=454586 RepID=UPI00292D747D|nr:hypothetical protein [Pedobacter agri]
MKKSDVIYILKDMPDEFCVEELIEKILLAQKIEIGLNQVKMGKVFSGIEGEKKVFNAKTIKTMNDAQNGVNIKEPIQDINHFLRNL